MKPEYSFVIPVFNRPDEVRELFQSMTTLEDSVVFEVILVEDGSVDTAASVVQDFAKRLDIIYLIKPNTGPGDSRNYGMSRARGHYYIILDSDCTLPKKYLMTIDGYVKRHQPDFFGGPDAAHQDFSVLQRGIDFAMTSFITTGGIRGHKKQVVRFEPRSFNMGLSSKAFKASGGFAHIHPGEDPDLTHRLWHLGFESQLISGAFVYHKRRLSWSKYARQVYKFGLARPILNKWHPAGAKWIFWLPGLWLIASLITLVIGLLGYWSFFVILMAYYAAVFISAGVMTKSISVAINATFAVWIQLYVYAFGFLRAHFLVSVLRQNPQRALPELFFKTAINE
jgi:glycosyltransferase involved in cell wall biosynthesis